MAIDYNSITKTATDTENGLSVELLGDDHPQESRTLFKLHYDGKALPFGVHFDAGYNELQAANPGMTPTDVAALMRKRNILTYSFFCVPGYPESAIGAEAIDSFLALCSVLMREKTQVRSIRIIFAPAELGEASHRDVLYPPLRAAF